MIIRLRDSVSIVSVALAFLLCLTSAVLTVAQSGHSGPILQAMKNETKGRYQKTEELKKKRNAAGRRARNAIVEDDIVTIETNIVNVDAVVTTKRPGRSSRAEAGNFAF